MTTDLWTLERRLWTEAEDAFAELMDMEAVMVFPEPIGILYDGNIVEEMEVTPRWTSCEMTNRWERRRDTVVILNYRATAKGPDGPDYVAICTSVWQDVDGSFRIVAHQQTPAEMTVAHPTLRRRHPSEGT